MAVSKGMKVYPSSGVMDLQRVLPKEMNRGADKDLFSCLKHPTNAQWSWKTSSCPQWMAQCHEMLVYFLKIAPNGLL